MGGGAVVGGIEIIEFIFTDPPDIADGMGGQLTQGIMARQLGLDLHPRQAILIDGDTCDFFVGQTKA